MKDNPPFFEIIAVAGVGLIGGSIGLAAKKRGLASRVIGIGRSAERLNRAVELGAIDEYSTDFETGAANADLVVVCVPVMKVVPIIQQISRSLKPGCIVTDVGSTKSLIVRGALKVLKPDNPFIGGHPMAGSEEAGVESAEADLFANAPYVLTRHEGINEGAFYKMKDFTAALGSNIYVMTPEEHDRRAAIISHVPHLFASVLMLAADESALELAAGSFRDATRVAASLPEIWSDICESNSEAIIYALGNIIERLETVRASLAKGDLDTIRRLFQDAKVARDALNIRRNW